MFENWTQWHWVAFAWGQLILAYIGYLVYLNRRETYLRRELRDELGTDTPRTISGNTVSNSTASNTKEDASSNA